MRRKEEVLVLFGSQTGNSEKAAIDVSDAIPKKLSTGQVEVSSRCMQLDDFLELERCRWTRIIVIITSSYGAGQAPLGCHRFREFCDAISENSSNVDAGMLNGIQYAMLGLGDSKFTTYFQNPTKIDASLTMAGAQRIGTLGNANASGKGENEQLQTIERWVDDIWDVLKEAIEKDPTKESQELLDSATKRTVALCQEINPDFDSYANKEESGRNIVNYVWGIMPVIFAILVALYWRAA